MYIRQINKTMEHDMMDPKNVDSWFMEMLALQSNGIRMIFKIFFLVKKI